MPIAARAFFVLYRSTSVTNADGIASTHWTLGGKKGPQTLRASVDGLATVAEFKASALAGDPAAIEILAGNNQTAPVNTMLPVPLKVVVTDRFLNHVEGVTVLFAGTDGTGKTAPASSAITDTAGVAVTNWVIRGVGEQTLNAHPPLTTWQATFYAYGTNQ